MLGGYLRRSGRMSGLELDCGLVTNLIVLQLARNNGSYSCDVPVKMCVWADKNKLVTRTVSRFFNKAFGRCSLFL